MASRKPPRKIPSRPKHHPKSPSRQAQKKRQHPPKRPTPVPTNGGRRPNGKKTGAAEGDGGGAAREVKARAREREKVREVRELRGTRAFIGAVEAVSGSGTNLMRGCR